MEESQFDRRLGGTEALPRHIQLKKFVQCRVEEINTMRSSLKSQPGKLAFQSLPKHMRRRAMSHNVKRLPRRVREIHLNQMKKSGAPVIRKRPSRKYRRKPRNLMEEYTRRAGRKYRWLQTHVWHAKRFRMIEKWGYKLPLNPCNKAFRACYRAVAKHCLIQDISYINCIEIAGNRTVIVDKFRQLSQPGIGLSIGAKVFSNGNREGQLILCNTSAKAIGQVNFHWQPNQTVENSKLWLWVHPAYYSEVLDTLTDTFQLNLVNDQYISSVTDIVVTKLNTQLSRFKLTGPLANAILHDTFVLVDPNTTVSESWITDYFVIDTNKNGATDQIEYWQNLKNVTDASEISPHIILSLIVKDPRFNIPQKRTKILSDPDNNLAVDTIPGNISQSPLWDDKFRKASVSSKICNAKLAEIRSNLLVPGSAMDTASFVPVMLIQRPGNRTGSIGFGSGWDVVIPTEWSIPFWISMIMRCARAGGLREDSSLLFEMGRTQFLAPDTGAGLKEEQDVTKSCKEKFFRRPPNKRTNFNKFSIVSPFQCNWKLLIQDWRTDNNPVEDFYVIRNRDVLNQIESVINSKKRVSMPNCVTDNSLIPVRLVCNQKGSLADFAIICLPKSGESKKDPVEPLCVDKLQQKRNERRKSHQTLLKKLRRKRIKQKRKDNKKPQVDTELLENYKKEMRSLWLPEPTTIRTSCSREIIGFVKKGGFSFFLGQSCGIGYITAGALPFLINLPARNKVLVRNTNTRQYRWARLNVITD